MSFIRRYVLNLLNRPAEKKFRRRRRKDKFRNNHGGQNSYNRNNNDEFDHGEPVRATE
jgi:hypothetical protein